MRFPACGPGWGAGFAEVAPRHGDYAVCAVACALRFVGEAHPALFGARYPALQAHAARCEALPEFREIVQPLAPPKG